MTAQDTATNDESEDYRTNEIEACPRCGGDHGEVRFKRFRRPAALGAHTFPWWWTCPTTREPVIAYIPETEVA